MKDGCCLCCWRWDWQTSSRCFLLFFAEEKSEDDLTACRICDSFKIRVFVTQLPSPHYTSTGVNNNEFCWLVACLLGLKLWASEIMNLILIPSINKPCRHRQWGNEGGLLQRRLIKGSTSWSVHVHRRRKANLNLIKLNSLPPKDQPSENLNWIQSQ